MKIHPSGLPMAAAASAVLLWAFTFPGSRFVLTYFEGGQVVLLRYIVACSAYLALCLLGKLPRPRLSDLPYLWVLGLLGVTSYHLLFILGMSQVEGGAAAMIIATNPVSVALLGRIFLGEKLPRIAWVGILVSMCGVGVIAFLKGTDGTPKGYLALLLAMFSISLYFVFQKPLSKRYSPLTVLAYSTFGGTVPFFIFLPGTTQAVLHAPWSAIMVIVIMGLCCSVLGYILWFNALSKLRVGIASSFIFLQPVFVTILSWLWLKEIPQLKTFFGGAIVLIGVALIFRNQIQHRSHK